MHEFYGIIVSNALLACILAIGILLLKRAWRNPAALHLLWLVVLLKLFLPPLYTSEFPFASEWMQTAVFANVSSEKSESAEPAVPNDVPGDFQGSGRVMGTSAERNNAAAWNVFAAGPKGRSWTLSSLLGGLWACGTALVAICYAYQINRFQKLLHDAEAPPEVVTSMARQIGGRLGLVRVPTILMTRLSLPPLVWSLGGAPRVILPARLFGRMSRDAQETILAHELAHVRRGDHLVRWLELAATTLFWWHPVVWLACSKLRDLEEECCDSRVLEIVPNKARAYAAALVDTLDFLAEQPRVVVPLPTAVCSTGTLARRICMLTHRRTYRLSVRSALLVALIAALPLAVAFATQEQEKSAKAIAPSNDSVATDASGDAAQAATVITGRVTSDSGEALADVLVKVAIPAKDMRFESYGAGFKTLQVKTAQDGQYKLELPANTKATTASINAMKPGYRSLIGTLMSGGDNRMVDISPEKAAQASFSLERALYVKGTVVDEQGAPVHGAKIFAGAEFADASGGIEITASTADGSFEIFNFPLQPFRRDKKFKGSIRFEHPDYILQTFADIYPLSTQQREAVRVVLASGQKISGGVLDLKGQAIADVIVEATSDAGGERKAIRTDANGRFALRGLVRGATTLRVHAMNLRQKIKMPITLDRDYDNLELRLQPIALAKEPQSIDVLGMKLTDLTPELRSVYDLYDQQGALILDPGKDFGRLEIGDLAEGYCFWMVGDQRIGNVRQFLEQVLAETAKQDADAEQYTCRVVYSFRTVDFAGTNTQYLALSKDDLKDLQKALAQLLGN